MMFTPTNYGVTADVAALADVTHAHGIPLLTDDAWGLEGAADESLAQFRVVA